MERFAKLVDSSQPLTIFTKHSILDFGQGSECAYGSISKLLQTESTKFITRNFLTKTV